DLIVAARERVVPGQRQDQVEPVVDFRDRADRSLLERIRVERASIEPLNAAALTEAGAGPGGAVRVEEDAVPAVGQRWTERSIREERVVDVVNAGLGQRVAEARQDHARAGDEELRTGCGERIAPKVPVPAAIALVVGFRSEERRVGE